MKMITLQNTKRKKSALFRTVQYVLFLWMSLLTWDGNAKTIELTMTNGDHSISSIFISDDCDNATDGGQIQGDEMGCNDPFFDPSPITNVVMPSGGTGALEFIWISTTDNPDNDFVVWTPIPGSTDPFYDPGPITQTTYYMRCARRAGCVDYVAESNPVEKKIQCCENITNGGIVLVNQDGCGPVYDPSILTNLIEPSGGIGDIEYLWFQSTVGPPFLPDSPDWAAIPNSNSPEYDPPAITQTTYFIRCARRAGCTTYAGESNIIIISVQPGPELENIVTSSPSCNGMNDGQISVEVSGGNEPYTYEWSNGGANNPTLTGLESGVYGLTITNNLDCSNEFAINLPSSPVLDVTIESTMIDCDGTMGTATAMVTGGTAPYTYFWSDENAQTTATATNLGVGNYFVLVTDANGCNITEETSIENQGDLSVNVTPSPVQCAGESNGSITASANGGMPPYMYQWNDGATTAMLNNLEAGEYSLTVTDQNNCTISMTVEVDEPDELIININTDMATCLGANDGVGHITGSGGTLPYTYLWSDENAQTTATATNLAVGAYVITVTDANNCSTVESLEIEAAGGFNILFNKIDVNCTNSTLGVAIANPDNNAAPYTYQWDDPAMQTTNRAENLDVGTYSVTVTDVNGCVQVDEVSIEMIGQLDLVVNKNDLTCSGENDGTATVSSNSGVAPFQYEWSNGETMATIDGLTLGTYTVTVTDASGCMGIDSVRIEITNAMMLEVTTTESTCETLTGTASVQVTNGTAPYTYLWNDTNMQTTATATNLPIGTYTVIVTDANACTEEATATIVPSSDLDISISSTSVACTGEQRASATVMINTGTAPFTYQWDDINMQTTATATDLVIGTYHVTVTDASGCEVSDSINIAVDTDLQITFEVINATCPESLDGSVTTTVTGGTAPYTYLWENGATTANLTGLFPGNYDLTVTDANGCEIVETATVNKPPALELNISSTNINCSMMSGSGAATATVTGGTSPYTYVWNDVNAQTTATATNLAAGTYTIMVTDANGCMISDMVTIEGVGDFIVNFDINNNDCADSQGASITANPSGGFGPYTYLWSTGATMQTITGLTPGTYEVTVTDINGCRVIASTTIDEMNALQLTLSGANVNCTNGTLGTATASVTGGTSPYTYAWDDANAQTTATASNLAVGTYTIVVTDANGCTVNSMITIEAVGDFTVTFETNNNACSETQNGSITAIPASGFAPYTYLWSTGATTATITGLAAGDYEVTVTDANGCEVVATGTVSESSALQLTLSGTNVNCMEGTLGTATASVTGGTSPYTYAWDDTNAQTTATATDLTVGTYMVVVTDVSGCTVSSMITIEAVGDFVVNFESDNNACSETQNGSITAIPASGFAPYTYLWSTGATTATITGLATGNYEVTVTDANGCEVTAVGTVSETTALQLTLSGANVNCSNGMLGSAVASVMGGTSPYTYLWNDENTQTTAIATGLNTGTYTVVVTDVNGCTVSSMITIETVGNFDVDIASSNLSCPDSNDGTAQTTVDGGESPYTYEWNNAAITADLTNLMAGTYTVTVTDANGCTGIGTTTITAPNELEVTVDATDASCNGVTGQATASTTGGTAPYTYFWSDPNMQSTATATNLEPGTYTVIVTDANDCNTSTEVTIGLSGALNVEINASSNSICEGGAIQLSTNPTGGQYTYSWSATAGNFDNANVSNPTYTMMTPGTYTISVEISDGQGCQGSGSIEVTVNPQPSITISPSNTGICSGNSITFRTVPNLANYTYSWTASGGSFDDANSSTPDYTMMTPGNYTIGVTVTSPDGCSTISSTMVTVTENPTCSATVESPISVRGGADGEASVNVFDGTAPYSFEWSNGDMTQNINGLGAGTYTVTVTDALGCFCTSSLTLNNPAKLGNFVWEDRDRDGIQDMNEPGIPNVQVILTGTDILGNPVMDTLFTDASGMYMFDGLEAGTYKVTFSTPDDYTPSDANVGNDEALDSDADPITGMTETVDLNYGEYNPDLDAGFYSNTVNIGDYVWFDIDRDGIQDANEGGVPNVQVFLIDLGFDQTYGTNDDMTIMSTFTDATGHYLFTDVPPGKYVIQFHPFSLPNGSIFTEVNQGGDDTLDSDAGEEGITEMFMIIEDQMDDLTFDAGIYQKCDNITDGGQIDGNEFVCGAGGDPSIITNVELPSGGFGDMEYLWMVSTTSPVFNGQNDPNWQIVPGATGPEYDPGPIFSTTYYARCARRECCITYFETEVITKYVSSFPTANIEDGASSVCTHEEATYTATFVGNSTAYSWNFGVDAVPATYTGRIAPDVSWTSPGTKTITLTTNMNGCESSTTMDVQVTNCFAPLGQFDGLSGELMDEAYVMLKWKTITEPFNSRFIIERADIKEEKFYTIDLMEGHGGEESHAYELIDPKPLLGHNIYRIKHMDVNGDYVFSETVSVYWQPSTVKDVHVFPNPFREKTTLQVLSPLEEEGTIQIVSAYGQVLEILPLAADTHQMELDFSNYPKGLYVIYICYNKYKKIAYRLLKTDEE